ncbi:hypothetical protein MX659_04350 [Coriobacteriia bacterium Es71-Z0120]|uniref:hypothetical protein n=1 Tax=Parvivirga hydrogeniphila TaxID=2939460 RepID=UPI002260E2EC|nr:hypothetical protein [Parvivirga hydrogeniphila]MCL4078831.1 hypothetical protein [Parvivirga hydrogeniphila]
MRSDRAEYQLGIDGWRAAVVTEAVRQDLLAPERRKRTARGEALAELGLEILGDLHDTALALKALSAR